MDMRPPSHGWYTFYMYILFNSFEGKGNEMLTINARESSIETKVINYNEQMRE